MSTEHLQNTPIQFADLHLDPQQRRIWRGKVNIHLPRLSFDLLLCLARHSPAVVTMDQLLAEVWGEVVVGDETVKQRVRMLRQSLNETADQPKYIESVRGIGYRLIPTVLEVEAEKAKTGRMRWMWPGIAAFALTLFMLTVFMVNIQMNHDDPVRKDNPLSLAVLPFKDMSANADQGYFSDGMHEEIITRLSHIPSLAVTSRTSVLPFRDVDMSIAEISAELEVNLIIEGSVRHSNEQIRITIQLIDAVSDEHLWAETYDRPLRIGEIFDIQSNVAEQVAAALQIELATDAVATAAKLPTESLDAYNNYLLGRYHVHRGNSLDIERSINFFEQAINIAPDFAEAHVGLGQALTFVGTTYGWLPPKEAFTRAELQVAEALRLNPESSDAYSLQGDILSWYRWNWLAAEKAYKLAIEKGAQIDLGYIILLSVLGRHDEAIPMMEEAIKTFPRDRWVRSNAAWRFLSAGDLERAKYEADAAIAIDDNYGDAFASRGWALLYLGKIDLALQAFEKNLELNKHSVSALAALAIAQYQAGNKQATIRLLNEILAVDTSSYSSYEMVARVFMTLGDFDTAIQWLQRAFDARSRGMIFLNEGKAWDPIRKDKRFQDIMRGLNM